MLSGFPARKSVPVRTLLSFGSIRLIHNVLKYSRKSQSLTAHAADPDSNLIITLATEGLFQKFRCRLKALVDTVLLIMVLGSNSEN